MLFPFSLLSPYPLNGFFLLGIPDISDNFGYCLVGWVLLRGLFFWTVFFLCCSVIIFHVW